MLKRWGALSGVASWPAAIIHSHSHQGQSMFRRCRSFLYSRRISVSKKTNSRRLKFEGLEGRTMFSAASVVGDFDGDGRDDFAEGFPSVGSGNAPGEVR